MRNALQALLENVLRRLRPEKPAVDPVADILTKVHPVHLIRALFALLLREAPDSKEIWSTFHIVFRDNYEAFSAALERNLEGDAVTDLLALFLIQVARNGLFVPERTARMRQLADELGVHIPTDDPTDRIRNFFALLLREEPDAKQIWSAFHIVFRDNYESFSAALNRNLEGADLTDL